MVRLATRSLYPIARSKLSFSYLFKEWDSDWDKGIIALEAGSGLGALSTLLKDNPDLLGDLGRASRPSVGAANVFNRVQCV